MILPNSHLKSALIPLERIRSQIQKNRPLEHPEMRITVSIGATEYPGRGTPDVEDLIARADKAMKELFYALRQEAGRVKQETSSSSNARLALRPL